MAVQSEWQKYSATWHDWQASGGRASGPPPQAVRDFIRAQNLTRDEQQRAKYGAAKLLSCSASEEIEKEALRKQAMAAGKGATIHANQDSDCFVSLSWKDGVVTAEFYRGGAIVYDYEMSKEEALDWFLSDSLGGYFNANVR